MTAEIESAIKRLDYIVSHDDHIKDILSKYYVFDDIELSPELKQRFEGVKIQETDTLTSLMNEIRITNRQIFRLDDFQRINYLVSVNTELMKRIDSIVDYIKETYTDDRHVIRYCLQHVYFKVEEIQEFLDVLPKMIDRLMKYNETISQCGKPK